MKNKPSFASYNFHKFKESSVLHSVAWSDEQESLIVVFKSGSVWIYKEANKDIYNNFIKAASPGSYFNNFIRNTLPSECVYKKGVSVG